MSRTIAFALFFALVIFGLVMLASAGSVEGQKKFNSSSYYVKHQILVGALPGLALFLVASKIPYKKWRTLSFPALLAAIALLVAVFVPGLGVGVKGATRWINLGPVTLQPAEILKLTLILYLAAWFSYRDRVESSIGRLVPFLLVVGFAGLLLALQPDFGTLGIVIVIGVAIYFFSGAPIKHFALLILIAGVMIGSLAIAAPYRFDRIKTFFHPRQDTQGRDYHINQALISIGSGGIWGLGYGQSKQKTNYLPEPVGDSIFAVIVEELGLVGGLVLIGGFVAFFWSLIALSERVPDMFGRLIILGVAAWISSQAFVNIAAITGLMPLTGIPLPLISYGSSSLVAIMTGMGIVRNVSKGVT